jgi:hypothetical protein
MRRVLHGFHTMNGNILVIFVAKSEYVSNLSFVLRSIVPAHGLSFGKPRALFTVIAEGVRFSRICGLDHLCNGRDQDIGGIQCEHDFLNLTK